MAHMYFRFGAMNCGKTTALLQVLHNYEEKGKKCLLIKPAIDKKAGSKVSSRIGLEREVDVLLLPDDVIKDNVNLDDISCILVDEAQFLKESQVLELWYITKMLNIPVIAYGLKTNFQGHLFEGSKALIEKCDKLEENATICRCGQKARFNARIVDGKFTLKGEEVSIDGLDALYEPLCGECYIKNVLKKDKF